MLENIDDKYIKYCNMCEQDQTEMLESVYTELLKIPVGVNVFVFKDKYVIPGKTGMFLF